MDLLLDHKANVNEVWENEVLQVSTEDPKPRFFGTALLWAIGQDEGGEEQAEKIKKLIKCGANPNLSMKQGGYSRFSVDMCGWAPLYAAIESRNINTIKSLLAGGAKKNADVNIVAFGGIKAEISAIDYATLLVSKEIKGDWKREFCRGDYIPTWIMSSTNYQIKDWLTKDALYTIHRLLASY
jgi:hypothetical protein